MKGFLCLLCSVILLLTFAVQSNAAIVTVSFDSGSQTLTAFNGITPLSGGTAADGDGAVLQLGYFTSGTSVTPFSGTWVALTGKGGVNSAFSTTSIGDFTSQGAGDGTFAMSLTFDTTDPTKNNALPAAGTPLGIRIYDGTSIASSTHYTTISSTLPAWDWQTPAAPPNNPVMGISLDDVSLFRENGTATGATFSTFNTNLAVPEPSVFALSGLAVLGMICSHRIQRRR